MYTVKTSVEVIAGNTATVIYPTMDSAVWAGIGETMQTMRADECAEYPDITGMKLRLVTSAEYGVYYVAEYVAADGYILVEDVFTVYEHNGGWVFDAIP